jgi:hypothetical protein
MNEEFLAFSAKELARWNRRVASILGISRMRMLSRAESVNYLSELRLIGDELELHSQAVERLAGQRAFDVEVRLDDVRSIIARLRSLIEEGEKDLRLRTRTLTSDRL